MELKDLIESIINDPNALLINENKDVEYKLINDYLTHINFYNVADDIVFPDRFYLNPEFLIRVLLNNGTVGRLNSLFYDDYSLTDNPVISALNLLYFGIKKANLDKDSSEQIILQYIKEHNYSPKILFPLLYPKLPLDEFYYDMGLSGYYKDRLVANCDLSWDNESEKKDLLHNYFYYDLFTENKLHFILNKFQYFKNSKYNTLLINEPYTFHYLPEKIKNDFVKIYDPKLILIRQKGANLKYYLNRNLDSDLIKKAIFQNYTNMLYAPENIKNDFEFANELLAKQGMMLEYFNDKIKANRDTVMIAVTQNGDALQYASNELRGDIAVIVAAVFYDGNDPSHPAMTRDIDRGVKNWNCLRWAILDDLNNFNTNFTIEELEQKLNIINATPYYNLQENVIDYLINGGESRLYKRNNEFKSGWTDNMQLVDLIGYFEDFTDDETLITVEILRDNGERDLLQMFNDDEEIMLMYGEENFEYFSATLKQDPSFILRILRRENCTQILEDDYPVNRLNKNIIPWILRIKETNEPAFSEINSYCINNKISYFNNLPEELKIHIAHNSTIGVINSILTFQVGVDIKYFLNYIERIPIDILRLSILNNIYNIKHLPINHELLNERELCLIVVSTNGLLIQYFSLVLKDDRDIAIQAVKSAGDAIQFLNTEKQNDFEIIQQAVFNVTGNGEIKNTNCIQWVTDERSKKYINALVNVTKILRYV